MSGLREAVVELASTCADLGLMHGDNADRHIAGDSDSYSMGLSRGRSMAYGVAAESLRNLLTAHPGSGAGDHRYVYMDQYQGTCACGSVLSFIGKSPAECLGAHILPAPAAPELLAGDA